MSSSATTGPSDPVFDVSNLLEEPLLGLADCKVVCGEKTWNLHKAILCSRSRYFKTAFFSAFSEAASNTVNFDLSEWDPVLLDAVIQFTYSGDGKYLAIICSKLQGFVVNNENIGETYTNLVEVYRVGDYLGIDHLCATAVEMLLKHNEEYVQDFRSRWCMKDHGEMVECFEVEEERQGFVLGAQNAYKLPKPPTAQDSPSPEKRYGIRWPFIRLFLNIAYPGHPWIINPVIPELRTAVPELVADVEFVKAVCSQVIEFQQNLLQHSPNIEENAVPNVDRFELSAMKKLREEVPELIVDIRHVLGLPVDVVDEQNGTEGQEF
ncbi:hypothetical protein B0T16DRAFT_455387 [Cercophora newfieldiana]|uniref:BTB domain-containing protein n=1 Tax=Cercophora newfieldiana TaxID=92897 RepID=A0AA40CXP7_9PEZI|nr:hypothetical protein B0T16DRAFT_455387 [Cercophora newfieldiana]